MTTTFLDNIDCAICDKIMGFMPASQTFMDYPHMICIDCAEILSSFAKLIGFHEEDIRFPNIQPSNVNSKKLADWIHQFKEWKIENDRKYNKTKQDSMPQLSINPGSEMDSVSSLSDGKAITKSTGETAKEFTTRHGHEPGIIIPDCKECLNDYGPK